MQRSIAKKILDIFFAIILLIALAPVFVVVSILIKLDSRGNVFFCQQRLGIHGKPFKMIKFRSMISNSEMKGTALFNYEGDVRVTKIGRLLRKYSIDELPQLVNILRGEMSFVGPRPPVVYELGDYETLNERYKKRFVIYPGITGLAQVMGRNSLGWDKKVDYDNYYIDLFKDKGILVDWKIVLLTVSKILKKDNICEMAEEDGVNSDEEANAAMQMVVSKAHDAQNVIPFIALAMLKKEVGI